MKKIKTFVLPALMLCSLSVNAANPKKKNKQEAPVEVVDTVSVDDFSFHFGRINSQGLRQYLVQRKDIEEKYMDEFMKGFMQKETTEEDKRMKARLAGMEIRQQVEAQVIPQAVAIINEDEDRLNRTKFLEGFRVGVMEEDVPGIGIDSTQAIVEKMVDYYHNTQMEKKYGDNRRQGEAFLKANAKNKDVKVTPSGLQYKILTKGDGPIPALTDKVKVNYRGTLLDGTEFDSSEKHGGPSEFGCGQVISGWTEALTMMPVGSKWTLYIPQQLAYGDREAGEIKPFSALIFEVELLDIVK